MCRSLNDDVNHHTLPVMAKMKRLETSYLDMRAYETSYLDMRACEVSYLDMRACESSYQIKNLRRVLGISLENYFSPVGHAWHLLPWFFHGQLNDFPLENYSTLCVVLCGNRWFTLFHYWNMDHYRRASTGEFPESMEVYPDETPWTVPEIRR